MHLYGHVLGLGLDRICPKPLHCLLLPIDLPLKLFIGIMCKREEIVSGST